jgi:Common central domain of tyrosinase
MNRRGFLGGCLAAATTKAVFGEKPCSYIDDLYPLNQTLFPGLRAPQSGNISGFTPEVGNAERPLWSSLKGSAANKYFQTLRSAYLKMIQLDSAGPMSPRSLHYQAWLHWSWCGGSSAMDIHHTSAFLGWHRAYLFYYERLIQVMSGVLDFRLAAWDWETSLNGAVPPAYNHQELIPDLKCTYVRRVPNGVSVTTGDVTGWLQPRVQPARSQEFMGLKDHPGLAAGGPHSGVHVSLGGFMGDLNLAALDPVFFAHHANVDRLWGAWYQRYGSLPQFFDGQDYPTEPWIFYDAKLDKYVSVTPQDVFQLGNLGYSYPGLNFHLFDYLTLNGTISEGDKIHLPLDAVTKFFEAMQQAVPAAAKALAAVAIDLTNPVKSQSKMRKILARVKQFTLPVVMQLELPDGAQPGSYSLFLRYGTSAVRLTRFTSAFYRAWKLSASPNSQSPSVPSRFAIPPRRMSGRSFSRSRNVT